MDDLLQIILDSLIKLLILVIPVLFAILTRAAVSYLKLQQKKLEIENREVEAFFLEKLAGLAISTAEELFDEQAKPDKLAYASTELSRMAAESGLNLSEQDTRLLIEGSLKRVKNELRIYNNGPTRIK